MTGFQIDENQVIPLHRIVCLHTSYEQAKSVTSCENAPELHLMNTHLSRKESSMGRAFLVLAGLYLLGAAGASAQGFTSAAWTNDSGVTEVPTTTVWAYNLGTSSSTTINGVNFVGVAGGNPSVTDKFSLNVPTVLSGDTNNITSLTNTGSSVLARDFLYNNASATLTLSGLTVGTTYSLNVYSVGWEAAGSRRSTWSSGSDTATLDVGQFGADNGIRVNYRFVATAATRTIQINALSSFTWHFYGLALSTVPVTFSTAAWTGDASVTEDSANNVWAYNLGTTSNATINGVNFLGLAGGNPSASGRFSLNVPSNYTNDANSLTSLTGTGSSIMARDFIYGNSNAVLTLSGLTVGTMYSLNVYSVGWEAAGGRRSVWTSGSDTATLDVGEFGDNNGVRVNYTFTAAATTRSIQINALSANTWHFYGLALNLVPKILVFDGVGTTGTRRADNVGSVNFNSIKTGSSSTAQSFTVRNQSGDTLTGLSLSKSGTNPGDFTVSSLASTTLAPGATTTFTVLFSPSATGTRSATVSFSSNEMASNPFDISVSGTGTNAAPTAITLTPSSIAENNAVGVVTSLAAVDADSSQTHTFTLIAGAGDGDNSLLSISGTALSLSVKANFEVKSSYKLRVKADDGYGGMIESALTLNITDVNELPSDILLSSSSFPETTLSGVQVAELSAVDEDAGATAVFKLVVGGAVDNSLFTISGNSLRLNTSPDFEKKGSYSLYIEASDGMGGLFYKTIVLTVLDVNESPTNITLSSAQIAENNFAGTVVGTLGAVDEDAGATATFKLVDGQGSSGNSGFSIDGNVLKIGFRANFEQQSAYSLRVEANDGLGGVFTRTFLINILNINDAPTDIAVSPAAFAENNAPQTTVGTLVAADEDAGATATYSLVIGPGDTDNSSFNIVNGLLRVGVTADFETKKSYSVRVMANDGNGGVFSKALTILVTNIVEPPVMSVRGSNILIPDGDVSPITADGTDYGTVLLGSQIIRTYVISNTGGDLPLKLFGTPRVRISGANSSDFSVLTMPRDLIESTVTTTATLQISFRPTAAGTRTARIEIQNDDPLRPNYSFVIQGKATYPPSTFNFSATNYDVKQGASSVLVTIVRSGGIAPASVRLRTVAGTATISNRLAFLGAVPNTDYTEQETTISFAQNETNKVVAITLIPKTGVQPNYIFQAEILSPSIGALIGTARLSSLRIFGRVRPSVAFITPGATTISTLSPYVVSGSVTDFEAAGINRVTVSLNGADPVDAILGTASSNTRPWSLTVTPSTISTNTLEVIAYDADGIASLPTRRDFAFTQRYKLDVTLPNNGTVALTTAKQLASQVTALTPTATIQPYAIKSGISLQVTARPLTTQHVFSHWSSLPSGIVASGPSFNYTMPDQNVASPITAVFVENPFQPTAGQGNTFHGLLRPMSAEQISVSSVGAITGTLTATSGAFSGALTYNGTTTNFSANFYGNGSAVFTTANAGSQTSLTLSNGDIFNMTFEEGEIHAQISRADSALCQGWASRAIYSSTNPVPQAMLNSRILTTGPFITGMYTMAISTNGNEDSLLRPIGEGYATLTLNQRGTINLSGVLADGTPWTASSAIVSGGRSPFFAQLITPGQAPVKNATYLGTFSGMLTFDTNNAFSDLTGNDLVWTRPEVPEVAGTSSTAVATQLYTNGWPSGITVDVVGALYNISLTIQEGLGLPTIEENPNNAYLEFTGGKLPSAVSYSNFGISNNTITGIPRKGSPFTLLITRQTGLFSGTFTPNWTNRATAMPAFQGIILQKGPARGGYGHFRSNRTNDSNPEVGRVTLDYVPAP